jgi:cytochrome c peroxidase
MKGKSFFLFALLGLLVLAACRQDEETTACAACPDEDLAAIPYRPAAYDLPLPDWMPDPAIPAGNPLTQEGVALGRFLFYDPILSSDSTMSCFSCHQQAKGFTSGTGKSIGVTGQATHRSAMSLVNTVFYGDRLLWDGSAHSIEQIVLAAVELPVELNEDWERLLLKLRRSERYPALFRRAFGIERREEISKELTARAVAQFVRTIVSYEARFDRVVWQNDGWLTEAEERGRQLFFLEQLDQTEEHPGCSHCHFNPLYTNNDFKNNGIDDVETLADFPDPGRGAVTGNLYDNGKFKVPTLRNIVLTAPYMHDGRYATLEEVLEHYSSGGHGVLNEDTNIKPFTLTEQQKQDMIAFLRTLTDLQMLENSAYGNPFEQ